MPQSAEEGVEETKLLFLPTQQPQMYVVSAIPDLLHYVIVSDP